MLILRMFCLPLCEEPINSLPLREDRFQLILGANDFDDSFDLWVMAWRVQYFL
jgi:hypothetical protein